MRPAGDCIFCDIVRGTVPAERVWSNGTHSAFLTPFPNTRGMTVVIPHAHLSSYVLSLSDEALCALVLASKVVAQLLDEAFSVGRTGLIAEGMGVDHAHTKLLPMHGVPREGRWTPVRSGESERRVYPMYPGFLASHDGPQANAEDLARDASLIRRVAKVYPG